MSDAAKDAELDRVASAAVRAKLKSGGAIDLQTAVEVEVKSAGFDADGVRERADVAESEARRRELERSAKELKASRQDELRAEFAAGRMSMPDFAKAAREAGISVGELKATLNERVAADKVAERTAGALTEIAVAGGAHNQHEPRREGAPRRQREHGRTSLEEPPARVRSPRSRRRTSAGRRTSTSCRRTRSCWWATCCSRRRSCRTRGRSPSPSATGCSTRSGGRGWRMCRTRAIAARACEGRRC